MEHGKKFGYVLGHFLERKEYAFLFAFIFLLDDRNPDVMTGTDAPILGHIVKIVS